MAKGNWTYPGLQDFPKIKSALIELNIVPETGIITDELGRRSRGVIPQCGQIIRVNGIKISRDRSVLYWLAC